MENTMRNILILILFSVASCNTADKNLIGKMVTKNIPSEDFKIKKGRPLQSTKTISTDTRIGNFNLIERLYDTVWYQTEKDYDDGKLEVETEFVIFDNKSWVVEREMENGRMEKVDSDDYARLVWLTDVALSGETVDPVSKQTASRNAAIVKNWSRDEVEYEGYWLKDEFNLYIVEADTQNEAKAALALIIANPNLSDFLDTEKYLLSTNIQK